MRIIEISALADEIYRNLWRMQDEGNRTVDTNKPNTKISTELVVLSEIDAEITDVEPNKPYIKVEVGLVSKRGKVARLWEYFENLEEANLFISEFDEVVIK